MSKIEKRIITWKWGNNETQDEHTTTRGFIFGNYGWSAADYMELVEEARKDFPHLTLEDIQISRVTDSTYMKGFKVVSFALEEGQAHPDYAAWDRFDFSY